MKLMKWLFGDINAKEVKKLAKIADEIIAMEPEFSGLTDSELRNMTFKFREELANGKTLDDILVPAFAVCREAGKRVLGKQAYKVQLIGGICVHQGRIAEMKTGEGKTLMATLPAYLNALSGKGVHVITVNDYLAKRDTEWMGKIYRFLGLTVSCVVHGVIGEARRQAYLADITYGTNSEFGFDYLRDNMVMEERQLVQRPLNFAIVDEIDSILIDEARTPLIISGESSKSTDLYRVANLFAKTLNKETDVKIDEKANSIALTDGVVVNKFGEVEEGSENKNGVLKAEKYFGIENLSDPNNIEISHHINQAIRANFLMKVDKDYVVKDGEIIIVDEFTGRLMYGRRYSNGLHQAIEAKEGIEVRSEQQTLATITIQNYFRMYNKLAGMTGTAKTEEEEFRHIYNMDVVVIPTNLPIQRVDEDDLIYKTLDGKFKAVIDDIEARHAKGQPILVGTITIETSEYISDLLRKRGIKHQVLNAKQHEREAEIVAQAGRYGAVTIATNMAGRGTDIMLGGNAEFLSRKELKKRGFEDEVIEQAFSFVDTDDEQILEARKLLKEIESKFDAEIKEEAAKVREAGGLHIIGTERHESRRIDNQLRGRSGRQGDTGSSRFYISFEDELMRKFISDKAKALVSSLGFDDDMALESKLLTNYVEKAQATVEGRNFGIRKHVLEYDDVMNRQREIIYSQRQSVLKGSDISSNIAAMTDKLIDQAIATYTEGYKYPEDWDIDGLLEYLSTIYLPQGSVVIENQEELTKETLKTLLSQEARELYAIKEEEVGSERMREIERAILLRVVDVKWIDHISAMDELKQGINLRAFGQQDPVIAYKQEGFDMFDELIHDIQLDTVRALYHVTVMTETERKTVARVTAETSAETESEGQKPVVKNGDKVGRNDLCPCGSGKKYKKCHGKNE